MPTQAQRTLELVDYRPQSVILFSDVYCLFYFWKRVSMRNNRREINRFICSNSCSLFKYFGCRAKGARDRDLVIMQPVGIQRKCLHAGHAYKEIYLGVSSGDLCYDIKVIRIACRNYY